MDLRGVTPASPGADPADRLSSLLEAAGKIGTVPGREAVPAEDTIATLLEALATPQIASLLQSIEQQRLPETHPVIEGLLRDAISAASVRDIPAALGKLTELLKLAPQQTEAILSEPALEPVRQDVAIVVRQLTSDAMSGAEENLTNAARLFETGASNEPESGGPILQTVLNLANRFFDQGRYADYVRAGELAQVVIDHASRTPEGALKAFSVIETLLDEAIAAISAGDIAGAIGKLTEVLKSAPQQADALLSHPALASIRAEIQTVVLRLTLEAKGDAEDKLANAARMIETGAPNKVEADTSDLETVLDVASRFFSQGRYADYVKAGDLAQTVIDQYGLAPVAIVTGLPVAAAGLPEVTGPSKATSWRGRRPVSASAWQRMVERSKVLWKRAPLLVLLLSWFAVGLLGAACSVLVRFFWTEVWEASWSAFGFEIWGVGFLALVGFGFYMRIRNFKS